jgi:hypothetical protein
MKVIAEALAYIFAGHCRLTAWTEIVEQIRLIVSVPSCLASAQLRGAGSTALRS